MSSPILTFMINLQTLLGSYNYSTFISSLTTLTLEQQATVHKRARWDTIDTPQASCRCWCAAKRNSNWKRLLLHEKKTHMYMYIYLLNCSIVLMAAGERCPLGVFASTECSLKKSSISILSLSESFTTFSWTTRSVPAAAISAFNFFPASQNAHDLGSSTGPNCHALTSARRIKDNKRKESDW